VQLHAFVTLPLDGGEWSDLSPRPLYLQEKKTGIHLTGSWMGLRVGLDTVAKIKIPSSPLAGIEPRSSSPYLNR